MASKRGRFGQFLACTGYPECKTTRKLIATKQAACAPPSRPDSGRECAALKPELRSSGPLRRVHRVHEVSRVHRSSSTKSTGAERPGDARQGRRSRRTEVRSAGRSSFGCSNYPDCDFVLWNRPISRDVPVLRRAVPRSRRSPGATGRQLLCNNSEDCDYLAVGRAAGAARPRFDRDHTARDRW